MGIVAFNTNVTGLVGEQVNPRLNTFVTTDSLATVLAAGYLNNQNKSGNPILLTDVFHGIYGFNTQTGRGTFGIFNVSYSSSTGFSLTQWFDPDNIIAARTANIGGAGIGPISVAVAGLTASSIVTGNIQASTNAVSIAKITATATGFDILFSADPGATATVNYIAFIAPV